MKRQFTYNDQKSYFKVVTLLFLLLFLFQQTLVAQNEGKKWYFGTHAGLDFSTTPPSVLLDGQINTLEGTATLSDENGELLFYTDGIQVYTKEHTIMPNSQDGLGGDPSSAQSAIIVPHPSNSDLFYLFTVSAYINSNVFYSIIDMNLNEGLGDIEPDAKAIPVLYGTGEYIQATPSSDGTFWWVLLHKSGTSNYYAYKVTSDGLDIENPVISSTGTPSGNNGDIGFIKFNNLGNKLVRTSYINNHFNISDFDNATGVVSNSLHFPLYAAYGAEFSPNNRFLYISAFSSMGVKQYDLYVGTTVSEIQSSVHTYSNTATGALQIAPDSKIYSSRYGALALDVIHSPNHQGSAATFQLNGQSLGGASAQLGLPNFITTLVSQTPPVVDDLFVSDISSETATIQATISSDGGASIIERGFYYGSTPNPDSNMTLVSGSTGNMTVSLENLEPSTTYYFSAFATNIHGTTLLTGGEFLTLEALDTEPPTAICVEEITIQLDENGIATITTLMIDNGSFDNVAIESISLDIYEFTCEHLGENLVTMTVIDTSGNSSSCQALVIVEDEFAPQMVCFEITLALNEEGFAFLNPQTFGFQITDNCSIEQSYIDFDTFDCSHIDEPTLVTYTTVDSSGNSTSCSFYVSVIDNQGPEILGIDDQFVDLPPSPLNFVLPDFFAEGIISALDNCTFPVNDFFQSPAPGTVLGEGIHTISVIARDDRGNSTLNTFKIFIDSLLSLEGEENLQNLVLYPNPALNVVHISNPHLQNIETVSIYDMVGRLVKTFNYEIPYETINMDLSNLAKAGYMVFIKGSKTQVVKQLIVK
ncbi:T9SS type A sorting domain-containing protein [Paucihalobacter sp.]|uniref:T9SS type A sorting domain-containing protein n=1 Tax=Paucihalobacter sp. TaxID=2850405 RepID=UPI003D160A4C